MDMASAEPALVPNESVIKSVAQASYTSVARASQTSVPQASYTSVAQASQKSGRKRKTRKKDRQRKPKKTNTRRTTEPTARLLSLYVQCPPGLKLHRRAKLRNNSDRRKGEEGKKSKGEEADRERK